MISLVKYLWTRGIDKRQKLKEEYEKALQRVEEDLAEVQADPGDGKDFVGIEETVDAPDSVQKETSCYKANGIITVLQSNHGVIDRDKFFEMECALSVCSDMKVGSKVEYLAYKNPVTDHIKIVKVLSVLDNYWGEEEEQPVDVDDTALDAMGATTYYKTHKRRLLGIISESREHEIVVDTENCLQVIRLDDIKLEFVPKSGDRIIMECYVQSDDSYVDQQGEIVQTNWLKPGRMKVGEKCTVKALETEFGVLDGNCYFTYDVLPPTLKLNVGDIVLADMIECEKLRFGWRAIKIVMRERKGEAISVSAPKRVENYAVYLEDDKIVRFNALFQTQKVTFKLKNNTKRIISCKNIELQGKKRRHIQSRLIDPLAESAFDLQPLEERTIVFEVQSEFFGESLEKFFLQFETFKLRRTIRISVSEDHKRQEVLTAHETSANSSLSGSLVGRQFLQHAREYAHQIWNNESEVVPGVSVLAKRRFLARTLGLFEVPERLKKAFLTTISRSEMENNVESLFHYLKSDVNFRNYTSRFQTLLHMEEIEVFVNFRQYDRERAHFTHFKEYLQLHIENLSEKRPSLVIGDTVRAINICSEDDNRQFDGIIHKVERDKILLKFHPAFHEKYNGEDYRLQFYFSRFNFRKCHHAVVVVPTTLGEQFLFPSKISLREKPQLPVRVDKEGKLWLGDEELNWYNANLNIVQKHAVTNIIRGECINMPYVIFGPPGTGKTVTVVESILQLVKRLPNTRLLVGAPSNSAANLIATRLANSGVLDPGDFVRLVSQNLIEKDMVPDHLKKYCATVDIALDGTCKDIMTIEESGMKLRCGVRFLGRHRITISTCSTLGNFMQMDFDPDHFSHVLIDEAGQCMEPEIMIPVCQVARRGGQVILSGDPNQLSPIVLNRYANEHGLSISFLERLLMRPPYQRNMERFKDTRGFDPRLVTKLIYNYRSLPSILKMYSDLFYDGELIPQIDPEESPEAKQLATTLELMPFFTSPSKSHGCFFYGVNHDNKQEDDSPSWYNIGEAKNILSIVIILLNNGIKADRIGIITPYQKQVKHLRQLFQPLFKEVPKIGSVEEFQGQERDIIFLSTVRSSTKYILSDLNYSLGFVQCAKRMNVAISRARSLLVVVGNPHLLCLDKCWRTYIQYCLDNDAYSGCDLPEGVFNNINEDAKDANAGESEKTTLA